jgi:DNA-binding NtrC family response regulator
MFDTEADARGYQGFEDSSPSARVKWSPPAPSVVIVSTDSDLRDDLADLLLGNSLTIVLMSGPEELRIVLETEMVVACLCGFQLSDGKFRDVVSLTKGQPVEVPVILVSAAESPSDRKDILDCLIAGAFDFISPPYRKTEVQRVVWSAVQAHSELARNKSGRKYISSTSQIKFGRGLLKSHADPAASQ